MKYTNISNQRFQVQVVDKSGVKKLVSLSPGDSAESAVETPHLVNLVANKLVKREQAA